MIYLIEDKTSRRNDYGWSNKRIGLYKDTICVIDSVSSLLDNAEILLSQDNVLLFHESFNIAADYSQKKEIESLINEIKIKNIHIAFFSGSKIQRTLNNNICNLPTEVMYPNLESFIKRHLAGETDFKYLLFGDNPELEDKLRNSIIEVNSSNVNAGTIESSKNFYFFVTSDSEVSLFPPYENVFLNDTFDYNCDDSSLSDTIKHDLTNDKYDGIFVPLCYGETLSDFLGLRLAMLIRCSKTRNKLTSIVIYGEAEYSDIITNECFDILKMPGVYYIHSDYQSIIEISQKLNDISESDYNTGLTKIHLNIPSDIGDNHSVSNKWAIHRWAHTLNIFEENDFNHVEDKVTNGLYFKYLNSKNSFNDTKYLQDKDLVLNLPQCKAKPKVLFIDDQANEGWYEAICHILYDINGLDFDCLGDKLKSKSRDKIISTIEDKIINNNPDIVILDLRLCPSDFSEKSIKNLTGNKALRAIKQINRGIQVLIFSSTKKVWNYQYLISKENFIDGADGFIVKENPEDSKDPLYTETIIKHFINNINNCCSNIYRKELWECLQDDIIKCSLSGSDYGNLLVRLLELAEESLFAVQTNFQFASIFINLFRIIEATASHYISEKPIQDDDKKYFFQFHNGQKLIKFDNDGRIVEGEIFRHDWKNLPYHQKICNTLHHLGTYSNKTYHLVNKRNNFIHTNKLECNEVEKFDVQDVLDIFEIVHKLIQNQKTI